MNAIFSRLIVKARAFRGNGGATAVEFAFVFPTLLLLTMMWFELGLLLMQQTLDNATRKAARLIRTGQAPTQAQFNAAVCSAASTLLSCANVQSRVQSATSFSSLSAAVTMSSSGTMSNTSYALGSSGSDVLAQAAYTHAIVTPLVSRFLGSNGYVLLVSTVAFQNEPD